MIACEFSSRARNGSSKWQAVCDAEGRFGEEGRREAFMRPFEGGKDIPFTTHST